MNERDGHGALADGAGDPLDRVVTDVTGGEEARQARLEEEGLPVEIPAGRRLDAQAGEDEPLLVAGDDALEPGRSRLLADEDEHRVGVALDLAVGSREGRPLQVRVATQRGGRSARSNLDVAELPDLVHEVRAHAGADVAAADDEVHGLREPREVDDRLP